MPGIQDALQLRQPGLADRAFCEIAQIELEEDKAGAVILLQDIRRIPGGIGKGVGVDLIPADVGIVQCGRGFHAGGRRVFGNAYACAQ